MTSIRRQLARLFVIPEPIPYEFRAERVDQPWDNRMGMVWTLAPLQR